MKVRIAHPLRPAVALTLAVVLYGNLVNLLPQYPYTAVYIPLNAVLGCLVGLAAWRWFGLDLQQMLQDGRGVVRGLIIGTGTGLAIVAPLYVALLVPPLTGLIAADPRHDELSTAAFLYTVLLRIPIGTALFEEFLFRGMLFALWLKAGNLRGAFLVPSAAFALWHVASTYVLIHAAQPDPSAALVSLFVLGSVVATFIGGLLFTLIRQDSRGVLGPTITHALINSLALIAVNLARGA